MENELLTILLKEFREFRQEEEKRWQENDEKWKQVDLQRITIETGKQKDRKEIMNAFESMEKSISKQFNYMEKYMNARCDRIMDLQTECQKDQILLEKEVESQKARIDFHNVRIQSLEKWRDNHDSEMIGTK